MKILRVTVVAISGALGGAFLGAALWGITSFVVNYASQDVTILGPAREIWKLMALVGAVYGLIPGFGLGLVVGGTGCGKVRGLLSGSAAGLILTALLLRILLNLPPVERQADGVLLLSISIAIIPLGALLGLVLASISARLRVWMSARRARQTQLEFPSARP
jgi:hypothetical protein